MVGDILRKERERQRMTIPEIEEGTSIRASYIEAIESGEYDKMPGRVYAKGFIKNYANFLNLNGDEIVKQFMSEVSPPAEVVEQTKDVTPESKGKNFSFSANGRRLEEVSSRFSSNHLVAAIIALAVLVGGFFYFKGSGTEVAQSDVTKPQEVQQVQQTTETTAPATPPAESVVTTPAAAAPAPKVEGVNLKASFSDDCWMLVTVDGNVVYEGVITAGQVMDWKGNTNVNVRVGNAGAVDFVMNGQSFGKLGGDGDVVDKDFTR